MRIAAMTALAVLALAGCGDRAETAPRKEQPIELIAGSFLPDRGPDGNSLLIDAPDGLILVDTGRHPDHRDKILARVRELGRPVAAIVNTHWHLDHTTGNAEILADFPRAEVIASHSVDGELFRQFMAKSRAGAQEYLASGKASPQQEAEIRRGFSVMDNLKPLQPTRPVTRSARMTIAGRSLDVHLAPFAATEGDVWIVDPREQVAIVGDLVVPPVPFMDTACADGWKAALEQIEKASWTKLIPGHGQPMDRSQFASWKTAFENFVDCGRSDRPVVDCTAAWVRDARPFVDAGDEPRIERMAAYYIDSRLRSSSEEQARYCKAPDRES